MARSSRGPTLSAAVTVSVALHLALLALLATTRPKTERVDVEVQRVPEPERGFVPYEAPLTGAADREGVAEGAVASSPTPRGAQKAHRMGAGAISQPGTPCNAVDPQVDVMLVLDYSCSMSGAPLADLKEATRDLLETLDGRAHLGAVLFSTAIDGEQPLSPGSVRAEPLIELIDHHEANGGTNTTDALRVARAELKRAALWRGGERHQRFVVLVSDGQPNDMASAMREARGLQRDGVTVVTLAIGGVGSTLSMMATPGASYALGDARGLGDAFDGVVTRLCAPQHARR